MLYLPRCPFCQPYPNPRVRPKIRWAKDKGGLPVRFKIVKVDGNSIAIMRHHKGDSEAINVAHRSVCFFTPSELREIARLMPK